MPRTHAMLCLLSKCWDFPLRTARSVQITSQPTVTGRRNALSRRKTQKKKMAPTFFRPNPRPHRAAPHHFHLVSPSQTKLQAAARGWLARRLARVLLLRGGCRRELDAASGAWQYVWTYRAASDDPAPAGGDGRRGHGGVGGEGLFRSWCPPALLKNEALPSPRAALRRVEGEEKKREARLALANDLLDNQRGQPSSRCEGPPGGMIALRRTSAVY